MPTPEQIARRERFNRLLTKWRTALPSEKPQIQADLSEMVNALLAVLAKRKKFSRSEECWLSSRAMIMAPGLVRSAENADPAGTSGFDRFAAQGTALSALIAFASWWKKPSPPRGSGNLRNTSGPISAPLSFLFRL